MNELLMRLVHEEEGATAIEYALLAALIALVIVGAISALGTNLKKVFENVGKAIK